MIGKSTYCPILHTVSFSIARWDYCVATTRPTCRCESQSEGGWDTSSKEENQVKARLKL
ncbi:hypothetical protein [Bacteroides sp. CG01]|uniref:hypothetical protein n=1 Tax=Bacteroides TaxID=816 RepID=UPI002AFFD992|nr:hypothetical protein [Bacteroides sp. CG01]